MHEKVMMFMFHLATRTRPVSCMHGAEWFRLDQALVHTVLLVLIPRISDVRPDGVYGTCQQQRGKDLTNCRVQDVQKLQRQIHVCRPRPQ